MLDCMTDLETWGVRPGCAIRSVGAAMFSTRGTGHGETFYMNVMLEDQKKLGLRVDPNTEAWWSLPKMQDAAKVFEKDPRPPREVASAFVDWWQAQGARRFWSQGGNFDDPILTAFLEACGEKPPWKFWDGRCTRTAYAMGDVEFNRVPRLGVAHHALDDCKHQIRCVQMAYSNLKLKD
jgi:hypothetical protein